MPVGRVLAVLLLVAARAVCEDTPGEPARVPVEPKQERAPLPLRVFTTHVELKEVVWDGDTAWAVAFLDAVHDTATAGAGGGGDGGAPSPLKDGAPSQPSPLEAALSELASYGLVRVGVVEKRSLLKHNGAGTLARLGVALDGPPAVVLFADQVRT